MKWIFRNAILDHFLFFFNSYFCTDRRWKYLQSIKNVKNVSSAQLQISFLLWNMKVQNTNKWVDRVEALLTQRKLCIGWMLARIVLCTTCWVCTHAQYLLKLQTENTLLLCITRQKATETLCDTFWCVKRYHVNSMNSVKLLDSLCENLCHLYTHNSENWLWN